jgi:hypothetical protein
MAYFPQYYLFVAHLKLNKLNEARHYYELRGPLPPRLAREAQQYYQELVKAEDAQKRNP